MRLVRDPRDGLGIVGAHVSAPDRTERDRSRDRPPARHRTEPTERKAFIRIRLVGRRRPAFSCFPTDRRANDPATRNSRQPIATQRLVSSDEVESVLAEWWQELLGYDTSVSTTISSSWAASL